MEGKNMTNVHDKVENENGILENLKKNRIPIILFEIGAYLHLLGRFSKEFIEAQAEKSSLSYDYKKICKDDYFFEGSELRDLLINNWAIFDKLTKAIPNLQTDKVICFSDFIEKHAWSDKPKGLLKVLSDAHGVASGIDKGLAGMGKDVKKQRKENTFKSTAFGYEKEIELLQDENRNFVSDITKIDNDKIKKTKKEFFDGLVDVLKIINENINKKEEEKEKYDNIYSQYKRFVELIKTYYPKTLGETRRPINEISLYDYAHPIASLTKSNLIKVLAEGWFEPRGRSKWRILKINIETIALLSKGLKIGDILGYKSAMDEAYEKIKELIEFKYCLGNEIYRDTTGIYFTFPAFKNSDDIDYIITLITDELKNLNRIDFSFHVSVSDETRTCVILSKEIEDGRKKMQYHHVAGFVKNLKEQAKKNNIEKTDDKDICPVCRINYKEKGEERCQNCNKRYRSRVNNWKEEKQDKIETIWLDEVADKNGRVALIVGQFDLRKWLSEDGFVGTLLSRSFEEWKESDSVKSNLIKLNINCLKDLEELLSDFLKNPNNYIKDNKLNEDVDNAWKEFFNTLVHVEKNKTANDFANDFWTAVALRDPTGEALKLGQDQYEEKAKYLVSLIFRKHPFLARLFRIWGTTQEFIEQEIFENILKNHWNSDLRTQRIKFEIDTKQIKKEEFTAFEVDIEGTRFSAVLTNKNDGEFISAVNLELLTKFGKSAEEICQKLKEKNIKLKSDNQRYWRSAKIIEAGLAEDFASYIPYTKIYDFPDQFMVMVPAYDALDIAEDILNKYEEQFGKVIDRLPFHMGVIAFDRRMPLYVAMDAGKKLLDTFRNEAQSLEAKVKNVNNDKTNKTVELEILKEEYSKESFLWKVPYNTGDPCVDDKWYPYIRNLNGKGRSSSFDYTGDENYVTHVTEIKADDVIEFEPSYFELMYLEHSADRYKVGEKLMPLHYIKRINDLWKEIKCKISSKTWSTSQIYAFKDEVERIKSFSKNLGFKSFEDLIEDNLINILGLSEKNGKELFDQIKRSLKDDKGLFERCLYWNLHVRKDK